MQMSYLICKKSYNATTEVGIGVKFGQKNSWPEYNKFVGSKVTQRSTRGQLRINNPFERIINPFKRIIYSFERISGGRIFFTMSP